MKKTLSMPFVALVVMALLPLIRVSAGQVTHTVTFDGDRLSIGTTNLGGATYSTVNYEGLYNTGDPGHPSLPVQYIKFSVPWNAVNFSVRASSTVGEVQQICWPVMPCQPDRMTVTLPDNDTYSSIVPYPENLAWVVDEGMVAGENHVVTVAVAPGTFTHDSGYQFNLMESVSIVLFYELAEKPSVYPLVRDGRNLREKGFEETRNEVVNPQDVAANAVSASSNPLRGYDENLAPDDDITDSVTYLIVTTPEMRHAMRRVAALRSQKGLDVKLVTMNDVVNDPVASHGDSIPQGVFSYISYTDDAGKLRQYIREHYLHHGTEYVLLAGTDIPYRYKNGGQADMYYGELTADFTYQMYKEYQLVAGRLLGTRKSQFNDYTDKLLRYELNPGNGDYSYLGKALMVLNSECEYAIDAMKDDITSFCPDTTIILERVDDGYPTGNAVLDSIGCNHYGFMSSFTEGTLSQIKVYGPDEDSRSYYLWALSGEKSVPNVTDTETGNGLDCMDNQEYPMIYFSPAGETMSYDSYATDNVEINYGESFTMGKDYGGPVYMGMTESSINPCSVDAELFSTDFVSRIASGQTILGEAYQQSKKHLNSIYWDIVFACHNYLGDPVIDMWSDMPQKYSGVSITRNNSSITVSGISSSGTIVAYHSNDGSTGKQIVTASSVTLNNVSPNSTVMLYKHNYIPYIAPLVLQNVTLNNSQYVIASEVTAGRSVDSSRTSGAVTVPEGVEYEIEATGRVTLAGGFTVEKGAYFAIRPASYKD